MAGALKETMHQFQIRTWMCGSVWGGKDVRVFTTVVLNRGAAAHHGAVRKCQGCRQVFFTFMPILAFWGAAKYWSNWPKVPRGKEGWEPLVYYLSLPSLSMTRYTIKAFFITTGDTIFVFGGPPVPH